MNSFFAYILWATLGMFGAHHAYLGRYNHGIAWLLTLGGFGFGWFRDAFMIPYYVALANDNPAEKEMRAVKLRIANGVPPFSLGRVALMWLVGQIVGKMFSCLVDVGEVGRENDAAAALIYGSLYTIGWAVGIHLVGNLGEETTGPFRALLPWVIAGGVFDAFSEESEYYATFVAGLIYTHRAKRFREKVAVNANICTRMTKYGIYCGLVSMLMSVALYNHGSLNVNGSNVNFKEALNNALNSEFWNDFDFNEFWEKMNADADGDGEDDGTEYFKWAFDVSGERSAKKALGMSPDATFAECKSAYRKLALKYHPDRIPRDATDAEKKEAELKFLKIKDAYEKLSDIEDRRKSKEDSKKKKKKKKKKKGKSRTADHVDL